MTTVEHNQHIPAKVPGSMTVADDEVVVCFNLWEVHGLSYKNDVLRVLLGTGAELEVKASREVYQQVHDYFKAVVDFKLRGLFGQKIELVEGACLAATISPE